MEFSWKLMSKPFLAIFATYAAFMDFSKNNTVDAIIMSVIAVSYVLGTYKVYRKALKKEGEHEHL